MTADLRNPSAVHTKAHKPRILQVVGRKQSPFLGVEQQAYSDLGYPKTATFTWANCAASAGTSVGEHVWDTTQWDSALGNQPESSTTAPCSEQMLLSVGHGNRKPDCLGTRTETVCGNNEHEACDTSASSLRRLRMAPEYIMPMAGPEWSPFLNH